MDIAQSEIIGEYKYEVIIEKHGICPTQHFINGYVQAMLFATPNESEEEGAGEFLSDRYSREDIAPECFEEIEKDCVAFMERCGDLLTTETDFFDIGSDFFYVRHGHGVGFKDRENHSWRAAEGFTRNAEKFRSTNFYVGNDNQIWME